MFVLSRFKTSLPPQPNIMSSTPLLCVRGLRENQGKGLSYVGVMHEVKCLEVSRSDREVLSTQEFAEISEKGAVLP